MHRKSRLAMAVAIASTGSMESVAQGNAPGESIEEVVVTGSRIKRQDYMANSPISTVTAEQMNITAGTTIDKYLNTLPQINPAGGSTSNNPPNNGQSNVDLRGLLIKPNQVGTLTDTFEAIDLAHTNGIDTVMSHRSGETTDMTIAHLATAFRCVYIKTGIVGGERTAKLNELIRIEEQIS